MQLDIFGVQETVEHKVMGLVHLLNMDRKPKEQYEIIHSKEMVKNRWLVMIANKDGDMLFNVVDSEGNVPQGYCVNWGILSLALHGINREINAKNAV